MAAEGEPPAEQTPPLTIAPAIPAIPPPRPDSFFGWDQLILLVTPFPLVFVARAGYILGLDNDAVDRIAGLYIDSVFMLSLMSVFLAPIAAVAGLLWLLGRNLYLRRFKRLALYAIVLVVLPLAMRSIDGDDLRFRLHERTYAQLADPAPMPPRSARCVVFDSIEDHSYIGGANFRPYQKLIVYVSEDLAGDDAPNIESFSPESKCPWPQSVRNIHRLKGRFYLADTFHF